MTCFWLTAANVPASAFIFDKALTIKWQPLDPASQDRSSSVPMKEFEDLVEVMARLRRECPWDREQTLGTLRTYLLEEAYECADALTQYSNLQNDESYRHLREELGDVLLQILFQSKILQEHHGDDPLKTLMVELKEKLIRRHPHIFQDGQALNSAEAVHRQWNEIKAKEKPKASSLLGDIPKAFTALLTAHKIGERSNKADFDWQTKEEVWKDVESEWRELQEASTESEKESELGDLLFSLAQWARHRNMSAEVALSGSNHRFVSRFQEMERLAADRGTPFKTLSRAEKEKLWSEAKRNLARK